MYATIAALYSHIGNQKSTEEVYGIYASIIEKFYGNNSLESANCYYSIGLFYIEQEMYQKAIKCFEKALYIMESIFQTTVHPSIADCHYFLSVIYKRKRLLDMAKGEIQK